METSMALMDAWRGRSNFWYHIYETALSAPALFKPEYVDEVRNNLVHAEEQFNLWRAAA